MAYTSDKERVQEAIDKLGAAFVWKDSKQGHEFWSRVVDRLEVIKREKELGYY